MAKARRRSSARVRRVALGASAASVLAAPFLCDLRFKRATQPLTDAWRRLPIEPRSATQLGVSFRTPQLAALGLEPRATLRRLLSYPMQMVRLVAYWNRMEPTPGAFYADELDWQLDAAERAGVNVILCVGPLKAFGYPEFFVPAHHLPHPFPEGRRIQPSMYPALLAAASEFMARVVDRYKRRPGIVAWQLEHEAVDPLGFEHSWRLDRAFVERELAALRAADPSRPIMMNGFMPSTLPVGMTQWWRTRDQGDSLAVAQALADIVGIDYYPCLALASVGGRTLYLDGRHRHWRHARLRRLATATRRRGQRLMVAEGQAEPWESVTTPPNPLGRGMYSCLPEQMIATYNACMRWCRGHAELDAYLFWGAEYWVLRAMNSDPTYLQAFARILEGDTSRR